LNIDEFYSEILPAEKAEIVRWLQASGRMVAMVGDGINDSPALSYADVGIAMKNGADVTREAADLILMEENLWKLVSAFDISREAIGLVRQNFALIAGLNAFAFALSIPRGMVSPGVTAFISNGSAILASLNAVRPILPY
ncbi:MAG TPA: HAD-IC family P-type ATPase, partial [Blastocatellia bacterium]|nr:HAD-IC family P-type ATPase [Blastocatellia bacterium]